MTYTKDSFRHLFQSKFDVLKWQLLLRDYFHADKIRISPDPLEEDAEDREGYYLGEMTTQDNYKLGFFYYEMKDVSVLRRKVGLRNLIKPYLRYGFDAALAVFSDGKFWRLSLICDLAEEATNTKRFTYVFGDEKAFYKTPILRFNGLQKNADSFKAIKEAFSVEALSDDFFEAYRKQYAEFVKFLTGKKYVKKGNKWVEEEEGEPDPQFFSSFGGDEKMVRDYVKKMMGRIVFLYFLQSKGWLAGNNHYMHDLFDGSKQQDDFLDKVLEPMFFGLLNTKPEDRGSAPLVNGVGVKYIPHAEQIPYLNGGLFQQEKIDEVDSRFPANMFKQLFDFFDSYNFTIDENDPNDAEVGVDPEMLGKIFENLLEDNKDKGAFYTPKEIVKYMCQESLIAYLQTHESDEAVKQHIANFVKTYNVEELGGVSSDLAVSIDQRLKDVKICDPAIGSGAFPMGLLRELYACRKAIEVFDTDNAADIKRHIIQNNIYGVDIEKGAVDIARLRFWLALIIDEKEPMPLPNLDFKIMQGNSLLESYKGVDLSQIQNEVKKGESTRIMGRRSKKMVVSKPELSFVFDEKDAQKNIQDLMKKYFDITDHAERDKCRNQINSYIKDYIKKCAEGNKDVSASVDDLEIPNDQFFLWHIYFADVFENGGFDVVIGNPPYISAKDQQNTLQLKNQRALLAKNNKYSALYQKWDLYVAFLEVAISVLAREMGICSMIVPFPLTNQLYAKKIREMLVKKYNLLELVDLNGTKIFANATVSNCIPFVRISTPEGKTLISKVNCEGEICHAFMQPHSKLVQDANSLVWNVTQEERTAKKHADLYKLGDFCYISKGMVLNADEKSAKGKFQKKDLISDFSDQIHSKMYIEGKDLEPYSIKRIRYLEYGTERVPGQLSRPTFPELYSTKKLLLNALGNLKVAVDMVGNYYCEQQVRMALLWKDLSSVDNKSIASSIKKFSRMERQQMEVLSTQVDMLYLLGVLNSHYASVLLTNIRAGDYHIVPEYLRNIPIVKASVKQQKEIIEVVWSILEVKNENPQADTSTLENKIDFLVYHLYDLTYDEVLVIDPNPPFTREEYEAYQVEQ